MRFKHMSTVIRSLMQASRLPAGLLLVVLLLDSVSFFLFPNDYTISRGYVADGNAKPDAIERLHRIIESRWPDARPFTVGAPDQAGSNRSKCPPETIWMEIRWRGSFPTADAIMNGPLDQDAAMLGLKSCALGLNYSRPQNLVWGPIGGFTVASILLGIALIMRRVRPGWSSSAFDWRPRTRAFRSIIIGAAGGLAVYTMCAAWSASWRADTPADLVSRELLLTTLLPAIISVPLVEEYLFRALLLERSSRAIGPWPALLLSSAAFTGLHMPDSMVFGLGLMLAGTGFGMIWLRTRSLLACFTAHAVFNLLASLALHWQLLAPGG